jgi:LacI family transcriptional regulator, galactose operon repressor
VLEVIRHLGYRPNELARSMVTQQTLTIALIVPDITNPFYPAMARGMQDVLATAGYHGIVASLEGYPAEPRTVVEQMVTRRVDGIAFAGYYQHNSDVQPAVDAGIPVVLLGHRSARPGVDAVTVDDFGGAQMAAEYLIGRGHRRIGFIRGPAGPGPIAEREDGYRAALAEAGLKADPAWVVHTSVGRQGGADGVAELLTLADPPTAVLCGNDMTAIGALDVTRERGLAVPQDLAVVGFDDIEAASLVTPALTTVLVPAREQGRTCARLLLRRLTDDDQQPPQAISFAPELIRRASA